MYKISYLRILCLLLFFQLISTAMTAQVKYSFARDTLEINGGQTFSNLLRVTNPYSETVVLTQGRQSKMLRTGMISIPDSIVLKAGETRSFPVKYLAERQTINNNLQVFEISLKSSSANIQVQQSARFLTQLKDVGGITIGTEEDEVYLSQLSNQAQVMVRVANNGFVPVTFKLVLTGVPDGLEFTGQTMNLVLQPGAQQLLPFTARNKEGTRNSADFTVTIQAVDQSNNQLAVKILRVVRVTSARRLNNGSDQFGGARSNTISLRYGSLSKNTSYYQLQANGKINTTETQQLEYRLNVDDYRRSDGNGINIYNTYLGYQTKLWGVKVGNIYTDVDFPLMGRGIVATAKLKGEGALSFYGMENNYLLFEQPKNSVASAKSFALDYILDDKSRWTRRLTALRSYDPVTGSTANQFSAKTGYRWKDGSVLGFEGGVSLEDQQSDYHTSPKNGGAGGINYSMHNDNYQFDGTGYYSTPYYTGLRRGTLTADASIARKLGETNRLVAHVSIQMRNPKYQDSLNTLITSVINKNATYIYELGYHTRINHFYMNFTPYFMDQRITSSVNPGTESAQEQLKSSSVRFAANLGYGGKVHSFSVLADYGYTYLNSSGRPPAPFHSLKVTSSYTMPLFGFSSYIQVNPFYLSDALSSTGLNSYTLYSFGPNIHFNAFKNTLSVQGSGMYSYYGFTNSNNYSVNGNVRYAMKGNWALTGDILYNVNKQNVGTPIYDPVTNRQVNPESIYFNNRQLRVGIEKQFGGQGGAGDKKLTLTYYEDRNSNGRRDAGEDAVGGLLVKINGEATLTNSKGTVEFRNMKKDAYTATVTNTKGWSLQEPTTVFLNKNKQLEIPLVKTQALNGCVKPVATKYLDKQPMLAGIRINAIDPNGKIHQTLTDDQGKFCFYLPRNEYTVYIETQGMPFSIENSKEQISLKGAPIGLLTFLYRDETRKVGITRF